MNYQDFIASKAPRVESSGIEPYAVHPLLFDWQAQIVRWAIRRGRAAIFADCGLGKTFMQIEWACQMTPQGTRSLIVAPLSVAQQTISEGEKLGVEIAYKAEPDDSGGIWITNYQRLHKFVGVEFNAIVLDECFSGDTSIDVFSIDMGIQKKYIKDVRRGDLILNASGVDRVSDVHRREIKYAVKIKADGREIVSSPNHPYFTQRGWVGAQDLEPGDCIIKSASAVRLVQKQVSFKENCQPQNAILRAILLSEMADEPSTTQSENSHQRGTCEDWAEGFVVASFGRSKGASQRRTDSQSQSHFRPEGEKENLPPIERTEASTFRAWGQWQGNDPPSANFAGCAWKRMDSGICLVTGQANSGLSYLLQDRHRESQAQSRYRGGWQVSPYKKIARSKEGIETDFVRVDSLEILEQGHPELERLRDEDGHVYFYDIGATRHPSFSVSGLLVHNSSILKSLDGKTRDLLLKEFTSIPYRLCCTATPSPNDLTELGNHAEFLGASSRREMLANYFVHDSKHGAGDGYRLKGHAEKAFWQWVAQWAVYIRCPSDLGFEDGDFILPALNISEEVVESNFIPEGCLYPDMPKGIQGRTQARKSSLSSRVRKAAEIIKESKEQWLVWHDLNPEGHDLAKLLKGKCVLIEGSTDDETRQVYEQSWRKGDVQTMVTKPGIFGFGLNWQHCHNLIYLGLSDSFEKWYQSVRRSWRFGQRFPVRVVVITSDAEISVVENIRRKEKQASELAEGIIAAMKDSQIAEVKGTRKAKATSKLDPAQGDGWTMYNGDCCEVIRGLPSEKIGFSIFSPPFSKLYAYSDSDADMGNCKSDAQFFEHFDFLIPELLRVTMPGRLCAVHCMDLSATKIADGYIGRKPFSDQIIEAFRNQGWIFATRITIDKNPQVAAHRTHTKTLAFLQKNKDSSWSWPMICDYLLVFQKPGVNPQHVKTDMTNEEWIEAAHGIWYDIDQTDTLNAFSAREEKDEAHLCPLQLGLIRRAIRLWSNRGDLVLSPFAGIGSEGVIALEQERQFIGIELKPSYFKQAVANLKNVVRQENLLAALA